MVPNRVHCKYQWDMLLSVWMNRRASENSLAHEIIRLNVIDIERGHRNTRRELSNRNSFAIFNSFFCRITTKPGCIALTDDGMWKKFDCRKRIPFICELKPRGPTKTTLQLHRKCSLKRSNNPWYSNAMQSNRSAIWAKIFHSKKRVMMCQ